MHIYINIYTYIYVCDQFLFFELIFSIIYMYFFLISQLLKMKALVTVTVTGMCQRSLNLNHHHLVKEDQLNQVMIDELKGEVDIPGLQQADIPKAQILSVSSSLQSYSRCIPQLRLDLQNLQ